MVDFMKAHFLNDALAFKSYLSGIYDVGDYFEIVEILEAYGVGGSTYSITKQLENGTDGATTNDTISYIKPWHFIVSRYQYWYRNLVMFLTLKLINMGVLEIDKVDGAQCPFYETIAPEWDNIYNGPGTSEESLSVVRSIHEKLVKDIFSLAGWEMACGYEFLDIDKDPEESVDVLLHDLCRNELFNEEISKQLKNSIEKSELAEIIIEEFYEEDIEGIDCVAFLSDRPYPSVNLIFDDLIPGSSYYFTLIGNQVAGLVIYQSERVKRNCEWVVDEGCFNMFSAFAAYFMYLQTPRPCLPMWGE